MLTFLVLRCAVLFVAQLSWLFDAFQLVPLLALTLNVPVAVNRWVVPGRDIG
jgi:hypothetical protein